MEQRFGNIVNEYYVKHFRQIFRKRQQRIASIRTREQALQYVSEVRAKIRNCFALDREERTPLNPRITAVHELKTYTLECIVLESRPGFYVTANLYLPKQRKGKIPGVLLLCGHNDDGKVCANGSIFASHLATNGIAVFAVDPVCQGERLQFSGKNMSLENVYGHNMLGKKMIAYGDFFGAWRAFDAVRSLDYLLERKEIDVARVYAAGCSGGGTLTTWLTAVDDRLAGSVPSCYITNWLHNVENELPVDAEQTPPGLAGCGIEMADFLIAAAPRFLHISGEKNDIFDPRGGHETFEEVRKIYQLLGAENKITCFFGPNSHGLKPEQRDAACRMIRKWTGSQIEYLPESKAEQVPADMKYAAPEGSVFNLPGNLSAVDLLLQRAGKIIASQPVLTKTQLAKVIAALLKISARPSLPYYRVLRAKGIPEYCISRFLLETPDTPVGVLHYLSETADFYHIPEGTKCLLYIPHWDSEDELVKFAKNEEQYGMRFSFDPFGIGEMTPSACDFYHREFGASYTYDYHFASLGMMLDKPYIGMRVRGILSAITLLRSIGYTEITLAGAGQSSVLAAFAALLAGKQISRAILIHPLKSYESILNKQTLWPQSGILPDILKYTDLPQLYKAIHAEMNGGCFHQIVK